MLPKENPGFNAVFAAEPELKNHIESNVAKTAPAAKYCSKGGLISGSTCPGSMQLEAVLRLLLHLVPVLRRGGYFYFPHCRPLESSSHQTSLSASFCPRSQLALPRPQTSHHPCPRRHHKLLEWFAWPISDSLLRRGGSRIGRQHTQA
jgi:hypothetical protein